MQQVRDDVIDGAARHSIEPMPHARTHAYIRFTDTVFYFTPLLCFSLPRLASPRLPLRCPLPPAAVTWLLSGGGGIISGSAVVDINCTTNNGWTPLHLASYSGSTELVQVMLGNGAEVNIKDGEGDTPLDLAIWGRHDAAADLLRDAGGKRGRELRRE